MFVRVSTTTLLMIALATLAFSAALSMAFTSVAQGREFIQVEGAPNEVPRPLRDVGISEHLGSKVDLTLRFRDETGREVALGEYFNPARPVLLSLAYYSCPNLCNFHLNGMTDGLKQMNWTIGREFQYVVVSIDPKETSAVASAKKANYLKAYGRLEAAKGWHFLTGDEAAVRALAKQIGFNYHWDEESQQWAHSAAAYVLTPNGEISRYLYGIVFDPQTVRLSLVEASNGLVGSLVDRLILYCFHYDPKASKYTLFAFNVMRGGAILIALVLVAFLLPFWRRQRKEARGLQGEV